MLAENRKKMGIALLFQTLGVIAMGLAFNYVDKGSGIWLICMGILLMLISLGIFLKYFKE